MRSLRRLLRDTQAVLLDFDGPVCDLFGTTPTAPIAQEIKEMARDEWGGLDREVEECHDSHGILQRLRDMYDEEAPTPRRRAPLDQANTIVTRHEYAAVNSAEPAPFFEELLDALLDLRKHLAIVSNNAEGPVWEYLKNAGLQSKVVAVCGRDPREPRHMKPHPDSLRRALRSLGGLDPSEALMVGDQLTDLRAARAAGVPFLGWTQDESRSRRMLRDGADAVVTSHAQVVNAAHELLAGYSESSSHTESNQACMLSTKKDAGDSVSRSLT